MTQSYDNTDAIVAACLGARALAPSDFPPDLPGDPAILGAPRWYRFEHEAWPVGETVRQSLQKHPKLKRDPRAIRAILDVVQNRNLRRGRESFVMALGFTAAAEHAPALVGLLDDPDIGGHIVSTLLKMRAAGYASQVSMLANHRQAWVRRLVSRYVTRYGVGA